MNGTTRILDDLIAGAEPGHNISGPNIVINVPMNDTEYICVSSALGAPSVRSPPGFLYIAGMYACINITNTYICAYGNCTSC